jgi:hypothetical protein
MRTMRVTLIVAALVATVAATALAGWPDRLFAPYAYLTGPRAFSIADCCKESGQKYFVLAFVIAGKDGQPRWDGTTPIDPHHPYYLDQIKAVRDQGGDVIVSFGGADGKEVALVEKDEQALAAKYDLLISTYHLGWLDFDIEGDAVADHAANLRRTRALVQLQQKHPGLRISYTLAGDPDGLSPDSRSLLTLARENGLSVKSVDVMVMDFGPHWAAGKTESAVSIATAESVHRQVDAVDPSIGVGLCALIGIADSKGEVFTQTDARVLEQYAAAHSWVCSLSYWCINRDVARPPMRDEFQTTAGIPQKPWDFAHIFQKFEG